MTAGRGFDYDVLIVGAGPVGLSLAVELGSRGVSALAVEQNLRTGQQPRAKTTNVRTMQHMRRWGLAGDIRAAAPFPASHPTNIVFRTRLFGDNLALIENAFCGARDVQDPRFPEAAQWIPQYKVEAVLRRRAETYPATRLRFGCRLEHLAEDAEGVTATILDLVTDEPSTVRVRHVAGADGARSAVRGMIGGRMQGRHAIAQHVNLVIRAPELHPVLEQEPGIMYWLVNPDTPGTTSPMDQGDLWTFGFSIAQGAAVDDAGIHRRIHAAFGRPVAAEIVTKDIWSAHSLMADIYATDRIHLIGDACHLHPPYGGYGMNLGIGDAVDLGWKLAAVLQGWGGPHLLASHEAERRPVHRRVIDEAIANFAVLPKDLVTPDLEQPGPVGESARQRLGERIRTDKVREFDTLGVVLGTGYEGSPIVTRDGSEPPAQHYARYTPSAHPGCLAPHAWVGPKRSLYDLFGPGFSLLVMDGSPDAAAGGWAAAARRRGLPLAIVRPDAPGLQDLYGARYALIRPDQHVAWRGDDLAADPGGILDLVRGATPANQQKDHSEGHEPWRATASILTH